MSKLNRVAILSKLKRLQNGIEYESVDDEGAAEFYAELQSVIDVVERNGSDEEIIEAANYVGHKLED